MGTRVEIRGRLSSVDPACDGAQDVVLRILRSGGVPPRTTTTDGTGAYAFSRLVKRTTVVRVGFLGIAGCEAVWSPKARVGSSVG